MSKEKRTQKGDGFMLKMAEFIVGKRYLIFLLLGIGIVFSMFSMQWVNVEYDLVEYLPDDSDSKEALNVMEDQFVTYGTAQLMFANVTLEEAWDIQEEICEIEGVQSVTFNETDTHYNHASALYDITFDYSSDNDACLEALDAVLEQFDDYDTYLSTDLGNGYAENLEQEVSVIIVIVAIIVIIVLLLTSETFAEVPVLLITFLSATILNMGTNFLLGTISFVSNSVTSILQLALSLDYAVILCNRFKEEHKALPTREAVVIALSKAIPEISSSSLTTIGGLAAMMFMQFKIGPDMAICLIKSILFALLAVFLIMPGLLVLFAPLMDKTKHKVLVPKVPFIGKFAYKTRYVIPPVFVALVVAAFLVSNNCPYVYGEDSIETPIQNETQIAKEMIRENFTSSNMVAVVMPKGDYAAEKAMLEELEAMEEIDYTMGLSNIEAMDGYCLADELTPRQFSELADLDYEVAQLLYTAYATSEEEYGDIMSGISTYKIPLMDIFMFVCEQVQEGYVTLGDEQMEMLDEAYVQMESAKLQLQGDEYNRALVYMKLPLGDDATYDFVEVIKETAEKYYPDETVYVVGNVTTEMDFKASFATDNITISIVSLLIVLAVLLLTFMSVGMPVLLILVIQGCIWINFAFPVFTNDPIFFMSYLVVSSIQMGANIDYAIVTASRYVDVRKEMSKKDAIIDAVNFAFPTILTSGTILTMAGILVGTMTSSGSIVGIGQSLGRGTIISIILVLFVLPQILLLGDKLIFRTSFSMPGKIGFSGKSAKGRVRVEGLVYGEIKGIVSGSINAVVDGDVDLKLVSGTVTEDKEGNENEENA